MKRVISKRAVRLQIACKSYSRTLSVMSAERCTAELLSRVGHLERRDSQHGYQAEWGSFAQGQDRSLSASCSNFVALCIEHCACHEVAQPILTYTHARSTGITTDTVTQFCLGSNRIGGRQLHSNLCHFAGRPANSRISLLAAD